MAVGAVNFFYFDKCPTAVIYFIKNYLEDLEGIWEKREIDEIIEIEKVFDPIKRISKYKKLISANKNSKFLNQLLLFFNKIYSSSSSPDTTLASLVIFLLAIFSQDTLIVISI